MSGGDPHRTPSFCIERYVPADLDALMEIENEAFSAPWTRQSYEDLAPLESVDIWVAREGEALVGYMLLQHIGEEMELHTLAVKADRRRCGIARDLLLHMIAEAGRLGITRIYLQVRPSNAPARALYTSLGFRVIGLRHQYYQDNAENALVMRLELEQVPS